MAIALAKDSLEVGCCRFHALFYTDRICRKPLTPGYRFLDMWEGDPRYMAGLVKMMNAFGELCREFSEQLAEHIE